MKKLLWHAALLALLAAPPLLLLWAPHLAALGHDPHGVLSSRAAVVRRAREGISLLRARHASPSPDGTWPDLDVELYGNMVKALRAEGEEP